MIATPPPKFPEKNTGPDQCRHPRVQIASRDENAEFLECLECGDIFDSSEFLDMSIEETKLNNEP